MTPAQEMDHLLLDFHVHGIDRDAREGQRQLGLELDSVRRAAQRRGFVIAFAACGVGFGVYALVTWLLEVCR